MLDKLPNAHVLDQYRNPSNSLAHYDGTADEIIEQCDGKLDMVVIATGTGGTISGLGRRFKERMPNCKVVGIDPKGSCIACTSASISFYEVEGIGYDFVPAVFDRKVVDHWCHSSDCDSFLMARRIMKEEGMLVGGSSGAALTGAIEACKHFGLGPKQRCVVIFADSIRNYLTKFLSDDWLMERRYIEPPGDGASNPAWSKPLEQLNLRSHPTIAEDTPLSIAQQVLQNSPAKSLLVRHPQDRSKFIGVMTQRTLIEAILRHRKLDLNVKVSEAMTRIPLHPLSPSQPIAVAAKKLERMEFCLIGPLKQGGYAIWSTETALEHLIPLSL